MTAWLLSGFLVACAAGLIGWHLRSWRAAQRATLDAPERDYHRRQFRRRMQTSVMLALVGASLPVGQWIMERARVLGPDTIWPRVGVFFWGGVLLLLAWVGVLALGDMWATKFYYGRLRDRYRIEQTKLEAELRRLQRNRGNGKSNGAGPRSGPQREDQEPETRS